MYLLHIDRHGGPVHGRFNLYAIGDLHCDRVEFDEARFTAWRTQIVKDPTAVAVFVGDALDGRIPGRKHFDADCVRPDFLQHLKSYVNHGLDVLEQYFRPIVKAGVPLVCVSGNHDEYLEEIGLTAELVRRLGGSARYLGGEGFIRVQTGDTRHRYATLIYATHGSGGGKTPGPKVNNMQRMYEWIEADVVMAGHVHDGDIRVIPSYTVQRKGQLTLQRKARTMYRAPSFVRRSVPGVVGYQGKKGFPSSDEGLMWVSLDPCHFLATRYELDVGL